MQYILDTDHVTLLENGHLACIERLNSVGYERVGLTAITVEERVQGWLSAIRRASTSAQSERLIWAYVGLRQTVQYLNGFTILDWTVPASQQFTELRKQVRIGTQDLRIASIALSTHAILVTRNLKDFSQVSQLQIEDWSA